MQLEGEATSRAIRLAGFVNTPLYVVHVMSIDAMEEIAKARKSGLLNFYIKAASLLVTFKLEIICSSLNSEENILFLMGYFPRDPAFVTLV